MTTILPGTQVQARRLTWEVVHVEPAGEQQRFRLRSLQGSLRGHELDLLSPFEEITPITTDLDPARPGRLRDWRLYHQAFLLEQALGPAALLAVQPGRLEIAPYQLVPVMRALEMSRPRLLLADGVGLGKTVEAGLVITELIARRRAHRILIVSPAGPLLSQWNREMRSRFGLRFQTVRDAGELQELRRSLVLGANPFDHVSYCLTSIDFAKQEKVLQELERTSWDLVVIDEAHHCVRLGTAGDWEDSRRRRLAEVLARQADGLLLLTATPHDGYDPHFASVMELLDPSLLDGRGALRGERYRRHVIRRLKEHIRNPKTGEPLFKLREVEPRPVLFSPGSHPRFAALQQSILALVAPRLRSAIRRKQYGEVLAFIALLKRSVSTVEACRSTLAVILERYQELVESGQEGQEARRQRLRTLRDYSRRLERYGALSWEEEQDQAALEAEDMAAEILASGADELVQHIGELHREQRRERDRLQRADETREALTALLALAQQATDEDPKLDAVLAELRAIRAATPSANVLVYTEYTDSQQAVMERLQRAIRSGELTGEVLAISGSDGEKVRTRITERFSAEDELILVSTDATSEGLNLHERCHHLVHLELPYNPNRLEQRNGRIDRYGQAKTPYVRYLYLAGTFEERLLLRLIIKYERQRARLTFVPNTLGGLTSDDRSAFRLLEGLAEEDNSLFQRPPREIRFDVEEQDEPESEAYRDLLLEVERAMAGFEKAARTQDWLGEAGLNADARLVDAAHRALDDGREQGKVSLVEFVCTALESDSAASDAVVRNGNGMLTLQLPPAWLHGLDGLPGYDPDRRTFRLATDPSLLRDDQGRSLGFLGHAHPLVRRALERVRNIRYGESGAYLDRRVAVVRSPSGEPELLATLLCSVRSELGAEYERLLAVRLRRGREPEPILEPETWEALATTDRAVSSRGVWERHFGDWAMGWRDEACAIIQKAFAPLADSFLSQHRSEMSREQEAADAWLRSRTEDLCGPLVIPQPGLFGEAPEVPRWQTLADPADRLAALATDGSIAPARRREADGVLRVYRARRSDLDRRMTLEVPAPAPLGLLLLVPAPAEIG